MIIIMRSTVKLGTTYHRLMFAICIGDIISSAATALNTLPMPTTAGDVYSFMGTRGTTGTCEAQGFAVYVGGNLSFTSSMNLALFYLLTIRFQLKDCIMTKIVEPFLHFSSIFFMFFTPIWYLKQGLFNPVPFANWCNIGDFPYGCKEDENVDCVRGGSNVGKGVDLHYSSNGDNVIAGVLVGVMVQVVSMLLIVHFVYKANKKSSRTSVEETNELSGSVTDEQPGRIDVDTRVIMKQACMYCAAFIATFCFSPVFQVKSQETERIWLTIMGLLLKPSQGTFNVIIFIQHKIFNLRKCSSENLSFREALYITIVTPSEVPEIVIDLEILACDEESENSNGNDNEHSNGNDNEHSNDNDDPVQRPKWFYQPTQPPTVKKTEEINNADAQCSQAPDQDSMVSSGLVSFELSKSSTRQSISIFSADSKFSLMPTDFSSKPSPFQRSDVNSEMMADSFDDGDKSQERRFRE